MSFQTIIQQLKGGTNSGNHGHQGRPGKRGGSAGGGVGMPAFIKSAEASAMIDSSIGKSYYTQPDMAKLELLNQGHTVDVVSEVHELIRDYGYGDNFQSAAMKTMESNIANNTPLGKALKDHIALETLAYNSYIKTAETHAKNKLNNVDKDYQDWEKHIENNTNVMTYGGKKFTEYYWKNESFSSPTEVKQAMRRDAKLELDNVGTLWRKGAQGQRPIESWTTREGGAATGPKLSNSMGYTHAKKLTDMPNYKVLAGMLTLAGAPGEDEITLINTNLLD